MANVKITELGPASTPLAGSELIEIVQGGVNKKVEVNEVGGGGGVTEFIELTDVPASYTGQASKVVAVKVDETGLEFVAGGGTTPTLQEVLTEGNNANGLEIILSDISGDIQKISATSGDINIDSDAYGVHIRADAGLTVDNGISVQNGIIIQNGLAGGVILNSSNTTAGRYVEFPDKDGTIAFLDDIPSGAVDSVNGQTGVVVLDSDDISEGATNLYFTDTRALGAIPDATPTVKGIAKLYTSLGSNTDGAVDQNTVNTALQGYIQLSGTTVGNPVTGDIEFGSVSVPTVGIINNQGGTVQSVVLDNDIGFVNIYSTPDAFTNYGQILVDGAGVSLINNGVSVVLNEQKGMFSVTDFSAEDPTDLNIYAQRQYVANAIAGVTTPDATPTVKGIAKLYTSLGTGTDGSIDRSTITAEINKIKSKFLFANGASLTGVTTEAVIQTLLIPANTYDSIDGFLLNVPVIKSVTSGSINFRFYQGTSSGATTTQIGVLALSNVNRINTFGSLYDIKGGFLNSTKGFTTNLNAPYAVANAVNTPITFDHTVDNWITVTANPSVTTEVCDVLNITATPLKY